MDSVHRKCRPAQHQFGFIQVGPWRKQVYQGSTTSESPLLGEVEYDPSTNLYTAYRLDGSRLDHLSGRPKHYCRWTDAAKELLCQP